jgi:hypothetical protein
VRGAPAVGKQGGALWVADQEPDPSLPQQRTPVRLNQTTKHPVSIEKFQITALHEQSRTRREQRISNRLKPFVA